jgi:hypothetical protein
MGDGLFAAPKRSNSTFIMIYLVHEMDIDYLVVDKMIISKLFDHNCMLRIGCKPMILITQTWLITCLKVFKVSCCRLDSVLKPVAGVELPKEVFTFRAR